ncbi:MAG: 5-(carboxyamino)imidazole ribonucleotide synthase [Deltaproteobacteria bacterium]|nr:MAG: 5-(carboxyamino)imidazole ribonucleotide synthase [Deltaproteobacteria bacterium]
MRIGILGGGQLGRMLAMAAHRNGLTPVIFSPDGGCATAVTDQNVIRPWDDHAALDAFAKSVDVCTFEVEHVPLAAVERVAARVPFHPNPEALKPTRDRLLEKQLLNGVGIPTAPFVDLTDDEDAARNVGNTVGFPALIKLRTGGYDGRGMFKVTTPEEAVAAFRELGSPCIAEGWVPWVRELSVIAVRTAEGELAYWDVGENVHKDGILRHSINPAPGLSEDKAQTLRDHARRLLEKLDYVGVIAIEFFETEDGLVANEIAPRVHNSGHWTQDGAWTCQFENHIRAIAGLPLGETALRRPAAMVNTIGGIPPLSELLADPRVAPHLYDKTARAGRKIGHVNLTADTTDERDALLDTIVAMCEAAGR